MASTPRSSGVSGIKITNSSPPYRAKVSCGRMHSRATPAKWASAWSPVEWPFSSLIFLKLSISNNEILNGVSLRRTFDSSRSNASSMPLRFKAPVKGSCRACALTRSSSWCSLASSASVASARTRIACSSSPVDLLCAAIERVAPTTCFNTGAISAIVLACSIWRAFSTSVSWNVPVERFISDRRSIKVANI